MSDATEPTEESTPETVDMAFYVCHACGAAVVDTDKHAAFHAELMNRKVTGMEERKPNRAERRHPGIVLPR